MNKYLLPWFQVSFFTCFSLLTNNSVTAQSISSDGTLSTPTEVTPTATGVEINGETTKEGNLFHSFKDFSVPTGSEAFFNNAPDVVNILNRVTGGNISNIDGLLRANGNANLFLINPAGILFGEGASLDIGGSFYGSTADSILFPDGVEFSATDTQAEPILTIKAPIGLSFRNNPGDIVNRSVGQNPNGETSYIGEAVGLQVPAGETLALVGGNVLLDNGNLTAKGGQIDIGSVRGAGEVGITETNTNFALDYNSVDSFGDITLQNSAVIDVTAAGGGSVNVRGQDFTLNNSSIFAGIASGLGLPDAQVGDITVNATGIVTLNNGSIFNFVDSNAIGNGGNINIEAKSLNVSNTGQIIATTLGQGDTRSVNIVAEETVSFDGRDERDSFPSGIFVTVREGATGNTRDIKITTGSLKITNRAQLSSNTKGNGNAGNINTLILMHKMKFPYQTQFFCRQW